jgi:hypothetical protein
LLLTEPHSLGMMEGSHRRQFLTEGFMKKSLSSFILLTMTATTLAAAPQAVVFDFGGVLTGEQNREAVVHFIQESFNLSREEFEKVNNKSDLL